MVHPPCLGQGRVEVEAPNCSQPRRGAGEEGGVGGGITCEGGVKNSLDRSSDRIFSTAKFRPKWRSRAALNAPLYSKRLDQASILGYWQDSKADMH